MAAPRLTLVTITVGQVGDRWAWEVDGPGGMLSGHATTHAEARTAAGEAAVKVLGRLEAPLGGHTLAAAIGGAA